MSDSILLSSAIYKFTLNKIGYHLDYDPNSEFSYVVSAKDSIGAIHSKANTDLAIALNELFEVVNG
jgi:hypothetical protein